MEELLDRVQYLLERMRDLAVCAARPETADSQRAAMQKELQLLEGILDSTVDQYEQEEHRHD